MLLQGSLDTVFFKRPQLSEDAWETCKPPPWEESSAVITCHQKSPSPPTLSQPSLGQQISSSSLAGVLQHHRFFPQPSLPLELLQVESLLPQPFAGRFPPVFTVEPTGKEEVTYLSPKNHCLPFSRRL